MQDEQSSRQDEQDVEGHAVRVRFGPAEQAEDVEAHRADEPSAGPADDQHDDVEGHRRKFR
jgi:hypothetical protein